MEESFKFPKHINYWLNEAKPDCFFIVGSEEGHTERIGAIKIFLMGYSEPLRAMLHDSELAEKGDIRLKDVEPETFWNFLKCVYGASRSILTQLPYEKCVNLLYIVEKYLLTDIKAEICEQLLLLFSYDNVFFALTQPVLFQNDSLKEHLQTFIKENFDKVIVDERFLQLNETAVINLLSISGNTTFKEIELWNIILRWAKHNTGSTDSKVIRSYIFNVLKYIKFLTMDFNDFWTEVVASGILLNEEVYEICKSFGTGIPHEIKHLCAGMITRGLYNGDQLTSSFFARSKYALIHWVISDATFQSCSTFVRVYHWMEHGWIVIVRKESYEKTNLITGRIKVLGRTQKWSINARIKTSFINHSKDDDLCITKILTFNESHGYQICFRHPWNDISNPQNGFIQDNSMIVTFQIQHIN